MTFPSRENLVVCFGHPAYQVKAAFDSLNTGVKSFEAKSFEEFERRIGEADVIVVSGFWKNHLLQKAPRLKFIQSISAGINRVRSRCPQSRRGPIGEHAGRQHECGFGSRDRSILAMSHDGCQTRGTIRPENSGARCKAIMPSAKTIWPERRSSSSVSGASAAVWRSWQRPST